MRTVSVFICILVFLSSKSQTPINLCSYLQSQFDSDTCCWRKLSSKNKFDSAANLILAYLNCSKKLSNPQSLKWHAGQMFALNGQNSKAKYYFRKTYSILNKWFGGKDGKAWYFYGKGTVAFLDNKKEKLKKIINKWNRKLPKDKNLSSLEKLYAEFGSSYRNIFK